LASRIDLSRYALASPILLSSSIFIAVIATLTPSNYLKSILTSLALGLTFIGGVIEIYLLAYIRSLKDYVIKGHTNIYLNFLQSGLYVGLYYIIIGILLIARELKSQLEYITGKVIQESKCNRVYSNLLFVLTLGLYLSPFQSCIFTELSNIPISNEDSEGLGLDSYKGEEDSGGLN